MKLQDASTGSYLMGFEYLGAPLPTPALCHTENRQEANGNILLVWKLLR